MNPLQSRLAGLRRRLRLVVAWRGLACLVALILCGAILAGLLDWRLHLPSVVRAFLLVCTLTGAGYVASKLLAPLWATTDDLSLALRVEDHYPILNDALASTVQFMQQPADSDTAGSPSLRREAIGRALRLAKGCNFNDVVNSRGILLAGGGALAAATLAVLLFLLAPGLVWTALMRFVEPFGSHSWTQLDIEPCPRRVALGMPFVIKGEVGGVIPQEVKIDVENRDELEGLNKIERKTVSIPRDGRERPPWRSGSSAKFEAPLDMTVPRSRFRFRVWANDAVYPADGSWHEVDVVPPPRLAMLDGLPSPQLVLRYPAYTDLPSPYKLPEGSQHIEAVAGTHVTLRAATNRPIRKAWIEFRPEVKPAPLALQLAPLGFSNPLDMSALAVGGHAVWGRIPAQLDAEGQRLKVAFMPWLSGYYILSLEDDDGLTQAYEWPVQIFPDPVPVVNLERPASNQDVLKDAEITLKIVVTDEKYAIRSAYLEYRKKDAEGNWLDAGPRRLPLYDHQALGRAIPQVLLALNATVPLPLTVIARCLPVTSHHSPHTARLRLRRLELEQRWPLEGLVKDGEILVIQACADDFNDVVPFNPPGKSHEIELRIVSRPELAKKIDEDLGQVQQELVRIQQMQKEALDKVKEVQQKLDKPGFKPNQDLIEAEQKQKQVQARVGTNAEEGLRADLKRLKQILKDNKLPPSDIKDRLRTLELELERIAQEDLQHIEPNLLEARKEGAGPKKPPDGKPPATKPPPTPKEKGPLDKARSHQENAKKAFDELVKFMDPWAGMFEIKGSARKILDKQRDLNKTTTKLKDKQKNMPEDQFKNELGKTADSQNELAMDMQDLLNRMEKAQEKRTKEGDAKAAQLLKEAFDIANNGLLPDKMRDAKKLLENKDGGNEPNPIFNEAITNQEDAVEKLEKVIAALEEHRDDQVAKLLDQQRREEEKLEKLRDRQEKLQKKAKQEKEAIDKLAKKKRELEDKLQKKEGDPAKLKAELENLHKQIQQHKRALEKLAEEQRELQKDVKEKARELARLQADQASKELSKAGQEMERAAKQLDNGEDPEEALNEAMERLENAQAKLQEAENKLAREQLAKIADRLRGLKARQDALTADSARLHKQSIEIRKHWTDPLLQSLKGLAKAQKVLGQETDSLKDKLKGAKVFEHILKKSVKAMDDSAEALEKRFDKGHLRKDMQLEKEEIADELQAQAETQRWQKEASRRLERLVDALKNEPGLARRPKPKENEKPPPEGQEGGGLRGPGDGIPPMAQLKALRDEQREVNERTTEFAKRFPNWPKVNAAEKARMADIQAELADIQTDQAAIQALFEEITGAPGKKGENP